jgi:formyltetrahydrofolate-dependent phosphoribosylglycinamide formyltransferase
MSLPDRPLARLVVLISGSGTNLQAILDACASGDISAQVALVVSNQAGAYGLQRAVEAGVPVLVKEKAKDEDRGAYDAALARLVAAASPDWVVLAGWMRILSSSFLSAFPNRVINLHPALPGTFPGTHAIERSYEAFRRGEIQAAGVMVHLVPDEGVDSGPVIAQETVPILNEDTIEVFEARMHRAEHQLLVRALGQVLQTSARENQGMP